MNGEGRRWRVPAWGWPLLALPVVAGVGFSTYRALERAVHARLEFALQTMLAADASALRQWLDSQASLAEVVAADPRVQDAIQDLIDVARRTGGDARALKGAPAQARLREILSPAVLRRENADYFVIEPGGVYVARIVDERIGERAAPTVADAAARALGGTPVFLAPTLKQEFAAVPMAFLLVPVRGADGRAMAVFAWRILPQRMAAILNAPRLGRSGETYAFDAEGLMVTESRFSEQMEKLGLLPPEAGGRTTAVLQLRDPGVPLDGVASVKTPPRSWPLTWAVAHAVSGRSGVNADGYRDYRGRPVVGAWQWVPEWRVGLVSELDRDEAYEMLRVVRRAFAALGGALLVVAAAIALSSLNIYNLLRKVQRAERLGQYTLEEKIGEGAMGSVYKARHAFLRRPTAIKLVRSDLVSPQALASFEREVQLTSQLTHPNTVAIYDYGKTPEGTFYYAMEYLPGLPLDQVIRGDGPQPEARVVHLVRQICASLAEAHRVGLVHRDVKPANVMLCERGGAFDFVKVLDFGLVKEAAVGIDSGAPGSGHVVGTPLFMSPESAMGAANVGPRSDVYAVGAVAYVLVTGRNVFTGHAGEVIAHHVHSAPVPPSERLGRAVDPFLERLILRCLSKRPEDRPADAAALLQTIEEGWRGAAWAQRDARAWWETTAPALLAGRRAAWAKVSRDPHLAVNVSSRAGVTQSLPELSLQEDGTVRPPPTDRG
jgi:eukaryotic-like serine/threonine-protein kinase